MDYWRYELKKRKIKLLVSILVFMLLISGCSSNETEMNEENSEIITDEEKFQVVTTIFAPNDWTKVILGSEIDNWDLTMLLNDGVDLHNYQPTAADIAKISSCDLFIYIGGHSDAWVEDALKVANNDEMTVIRLMDITSDHLHFEEFVQGMEAHDHSHAHESHEDHEDHDHPADHESHEDHGDHDHHAEHESHEDHDHASEADEHIWLSLKNAILCSNAIYEAIISIDPGNQSIYENNVLAYIDELNTLDKDYSNMVKKSDISTVIFADRFPFRYLIEDYNLDYYAAFSGCSSDIEASFDTIIFLADRVDALELNSIFILEGSDGKIAEAVKENSNNKELKVLEINSMQSISKEAIKEGANYLSLMRDNFKQLDKALIGE